MVRVYKEKKNSIGILLKKKHTVITPEKNE